jgi:hypothetical protein
MGRIKQDLAAREVTLGAALAGVTAEAREQALTTYRRQAEGITALVTLGSGAGGGP